MKGFSIYFYFHPAKMFKWGYMKALGFESKEGYGAVENQYLFVNTGSILIDQEANPSEGLLNLSSSGWESYVRKYIAWHKVDFADRLSEELRELYFKVRSALELGIRLTWGSFSVTSVSLKDGIPFARRAKLDMVNNEPIDTVSIRAGIGPSISGPINTYDPEGYVWDADQKAYIQVEPKEETEPSKLLGTYTTQQLLEEIQSRFKD